MNSPERANSPRPKPSLTLWQLIRRLGAFFVVCGLGTFIDLYSKHWVFQEWGFPNGQSRPWIEGWVIFRFHTSFNPGALWGIGQDFTRLLVVLSMVAVVVILYWVFVRNATRSWLLTICLALILAGTLGNLYDRLGWHGYVDGNGERYYAVRDFLLFRFGTFLWPVFNLADVLLVTGAGCLIVQSLFGRPLGGTSSETGRLGHS